MAHNRQNSSHFQHDPRLNLHQLAEERGPLDTMSTLIELSTTVGQLETDLRHAQAEITRVRTTNVFLLETLAAHSHNQHASQIESRTTSSPVNANALQVSERKREFLRAKLSTAESRYRLLKVKYDKLKVGLRFLRQFPPRRQVGAETPATSESSSSTPIGIIPNDVDPQQVDLVHLNDNDDAVHNVAAITDDYSPQKLVDNIASPPVIHPVLFKKPKDDTTTANPPPTAAHQNQHSPSNHFSSSIHPSILATLSSGPPLLESNHANPHSKIPFAPKTMLPHRFGLPQQRAPALRRLKDYSDLDYDSAPPPAVIPPISSSSISAATARTDLPAHSASRNPAATPHAPLETSLSTVSLASNTVSSPDPNNPATVDSVACKDQNPHSNSNSNPRSADCDLEASKILFSDRTTEKEQMQGSEEGEILEY